MFRLTKIEGGRINVFEPEFIEASAIEITEGEALSVNNGKLVKCAQTAKPTFIALETVSAQDANRIIPVGRVESNQVYEVPLSVSITSAVVVGAKLTIGSDALTVTATTTDGVATVVSTNGASVAGDTVLVRFA